MKIYHYAPVDSWRDIKEGSWRSGGNPGLGASRRVCQDNFDDAGAREGAVFGLLEPEPYSWVNITEFPVAWENLLAQVGRLLLAYEPSDEIVDKSFIIDWSHRERTLGGHKDDLGKESGRVISSGDRRTSERAYWASRVPLADYIERPETLAGIVLPEVITMGNVPTSLIEIADRQPRLGNMSPSAKESLLTAIKHNTELKVLSTYVRA